MQNQQIKINILVKINAKKTALVAVNGQELHISLHAKPHKGEANKELIAYLAALFQLPKSQVILHRGEKSKHKQILVPLTKKMQQVLDNPTAVNNSRIRRIKCGE